MKCLIIFTRLLLSSGPLLWGAPFTCTSVLTNKVKVAFGEPLYAMGVGALSPGKYNQAGFLKQREA